MVRIFSQGFEYGKMFSKSKANMYEDKKKTFRIEIFERLGFRSDSI